MYQWQYIKQPVWKWKPMAKSRKPSNEMTKQMKEECVIVILM